MWNDNYGNYSFYLNIREPTYEDESTNKNEIELKKIEDFDGQGTKSSKTAV
jgi:magnesium-transporting ATPase (P-type)